LTIEFSCQHCGKVLSTSDEKAGRKAKCPQCGEVIVVPAAATADEDQFASDDDDDAGLSPPPLPGAAKMKNCPMCGERIPASAKKCEFCGEDLYATAEAGPRGHHKINANEALSSAWKIYKAEMGITIGGLIVAGLLNLVVQLPQQVLNFMAEFSRGQGDLDTANVLTIASLCFMPLSYLGGWFLQLGQARLLLNIARGQPAQISDLFSGGKYFWRMVGSSILFTIAVVVGFVLCIVPGVIVLLMLWPYVFVLVDEDAPGIECLSRARAVTKDNLGSSFVLAILSLGLVLLGLLAVCIGVVFTGPLAALMFAVAYCQMTGQRTAE
jgi:phage FluMu protein Com